MPSVCFYFQVHQPFRLRPFSYFSSQASSAARLDYFDHQKNGAIMRKVADKCYLPTNALLLKLLQRFDGRFKISYAITGVAIEQMKMYAPEVLESFQRLVETGHVELVAETYYHSLAAVYDPVEFREQVRLHSLLMRKEFGVVPTVFRNTELIYSDAVGKLVSDLGYKAVIAEGADDILDWRSPNFVYSVPNTYTPAPPHGNPDLAKGPLKLLLKNYRLSDDIAFRFSNRGWEEFPLTTEKYASWVHRVSGNGDTVNLFMDFETFGEHQWASTGIFDFLEHLPEAILRHPDWGFQTPSETIAKYPIISDLSVGRLTSWADTHRDLTAWQGNRMQQGALHNAFELGRELRALGDPHLLDSWRRLLTSDHFYYMCTKWFADGDVHAYFSPYESPYEAYINYMNVFRDFSARARRATQSSVAAALG